MCMCLGGNVLLETGCSVERDLVLQSVSGVVVHHAPQRGLLVPRRVATHCPLSNTTYGCRPFLYLSNGY